MKDPWGRAQRVAPTYFLDHILPSLPSGLSVDDMLASIRRTGKKSQRFITRCGRWRGFSQNPASDTRNKESMFAHFAGMVDAIARAGVARGAQSTMRLAQHLGQEEAPLNDSTLPDGCIIPAGGDNETWEDIAAIGWYSKSADATSTAAVSTPMQSHAHSLSLVQTIQRLQRSLAHGMSNARRRFMFGFTIRNREMDLWFMDPTQLIVSDPVDWITVRSSLLG